MPGRDRCGVFDTHPNLAWLSPSTVPTPMAPPADLVDRVRSIDMMVAHLSGGGRSPGGVPVLQSTAAPLRADVVILGPGMGRATPALPPAPPRGSGPGLGPRDS